MKKLFRRNRGITLIALIITIIILLILAGITIASLTNSGLFIKTQQAKEETENAQEKENAILDEYENAIDQYINGRSIIEDGGETTEEIKWDYDDDGNITDGEITVKIGDYINYDPTDGATTMSYTSSSSANGYADQVFNLSSYSYGWRVLGVENGQLILISEDLIGPDSGGASSSTYNRTYFYLKGRNGYANAISELDNISALYGQGKYATSARSITVDDINAITGYDPSNPANGNVSKYGGSGAINEYGNEVTFYWNGTEKPYYSGTNGKTGSLSTTHSSGFTYWNGSAFTTSSVSNSATTSDMEEIITLTSDYYLYYPNTLTTSSSGTIYGIDTTSTEYYMLFTNSVTGEYSSDGFEYWLSSRCVFIASNYERVGVRDVYDGRVSGQRYVQLKR